ncbi:MAG: AmmeMemoRadiSam system radical SAM enzyme [Candidatus Bathyarchaeota archaeon]|nr:MAG: AmmeMemoRadiSam system radical SAM enzyme [Candidatus Bathyarchaeota archaeon]
MKGAMFYGELEDQAVRCGLCPHRCVIQEKKRGICGVRENQEGKLYSLVYGRAISCAIDPIEKKPLFHFYPGSEAYSIATVGCNLRCGNCQNYQISQMPKDGGRIEGTEIPPEKVVEEARSAECKSIAYTYTEPTIWFEYAYDTSIIASKKGIKNVFVTNGYITEEALKTAARHLDAANIDLKSMREDFYRENCGGHLQPVLDSIRLYKKLGIWIELTTLVIPTLNDSTEELQQIADFIVSVGKEIPWHVTRFYPHYKLLNLPPTPIETLQRAREIGLESGLKYVYEGNVPGEGGENTYCWNCGKILIRRLGYRILTNEIKDSRCRFCRERIDGKGMK